MRRILRLLFIVVVAPVVGILCLLTGCQSSLLYYPRPYGRGEVEDWNARPGTTVIDYATSDGRQQAYLMVPEHRPGRLWVVCGGNATLALEWSEWLRENGGEREAWLLVDLPGYGACEGSSRPASIRRSLREVVPAAMRELGWTMEGDRERLRFFGQSLGAAVCLMAAEEHDIRKGVLLSPFTSTMEMTREMFGVDLGFLVWQRFDNPARLRGLAERGDAEVHILHGSDDEVIPAAMSRRMAADFPTLVRHKEVPQGRHNDLHLVAPGWIRSAIRSAAE